MNYDLFRLSCEVSAKRLFPNFSFMDSPFNKQFYKGDYNTEVAYMGCRTRVMANVVDENKAITKGLVQVDGVYDEHRINGLVVDNEDVYNTVYDCLGKNVYGIDPNVPFSFYIIYI